MNENTEQLLLMGMGWPHESGKPGDLPIERPARSEFVVDVRSAKALGLTIPPLLRLRADRAIQ